MQRTLHSLDQARLARRRRKAVRLAVEPLDERVVPATFTVTTVADAGAGSLRQAILDANASSGPDDIAFNIGGAGVRTIQPTSALPEVTGPVVIDGTTQPGFAGSPLVVLNGAQAGADVHGLTISGGNSTVRGLVISTFSGDGIVLRTNGGNVVAGNFIGTDAAGATKAGNLNGVVVAATSAGNTIGGTAAADRNVISGNRFGGVSLAGANNHVRGNYVGTDRTGIVALGNGSTAGGSGGILITGANNTIGGTAAGAGNVISGNPNQGLVSSATGTLVQGNLVGTDAAGTAAVPNGVGVGFQEVGNTLGGTAAGARNVISGNRFWGASVGNGNVVQGNFIGTDVTGTAALGNGEVGLYAGSSVIGGTTPEARNVISGSGTYGIWAHGTSTRVQGNFVGTDVTGTIALGNARGMVVGGSSPNTFHVIGGAETGAGNLISGNRDFGLYIGGGRNRIEGNRIGTDVTGTQPLGNGVGVFVHGDEDTIGGTAAGAGNLISGNAGIGLQIPFSADRHTVQGNLIGTDASGTAALGNGIGIRLTGLENLIGGPGAGAGNLISGNQGDGIAFADTDARFNRVEGNRIGTAADGSTALGNGGAGLGIAGGSDNVIGGAPGNTIAFNGGAGVVVQGAGALRNAVRGNAIHSNAGLGIDLGGDGVTANDAGDADAGPNGLQNFPALSASYAPGGVRVYGTLTSTPGTAFTLDFYAGPAADPSGFGEGFRHLGSAAVTTNAGGIASFDRTLTVAIVTGEVVTATATSAAGSSSEFSPALVPTTEVAIDVRPGDPANAIDLNLTGGLAVAFLTTPAFDAATVDASDLSAIRFGDPAGTAWVSPESATLADADGDGDQDRVLVFSIPAIAQADALTGVSAQAQLTGRTLTGLPIRGLDAVSVTPLNHPPAVTTNAGLVIDRGATAVITAAALAAADPNDDPVTYTVTAGPVHGALLVAGSPAATFTQADVDAGRVAYRQDGALVTADAFTFTVGDGRLTSDPATFEITIAAIPRVTLQPVAQTAFAGAQITFAADADGSPTVQWQVSVDGGQSFQDVPGATAPALTFKPEAAQHGNLYRAVFTNPAGSATTTAVALTITSGLTLVTDPVSQTAAVGTLVTFTAAASGTPRPRVQWQVSTDGGATFANIPGAVGVRLRVRALGTVDGNLYRALFTNPAGTAATTVAALTTNYAVNVAGLGRRVSVPVGAAVSLTGSVRGLTAPTIQWEASVDQGRTYTPVAGATAATLTFPAAAADNGARYRAVFTEGTRVRRTAPVVLVVGDPPAVATPPADVTVAAGGAATFSVAVAGTAPVKVQWQVSADGGKTYTNVRFATKATLTLKNVKAALTGNLYRAVVTNAFDQLASPAAALTVA